MESETLKVCTHPVVVGEGLDEVFSDGLGGAQLCHAHGVAVVHHDHHILPLRLYRF